MKSANRVALCIVLSAATLQGCAAPRAVGKAASGVVTGAGKLATGVVKGTSKAAGAVTRPLR